MAAKKGSDGGPSRPGNGSRGDEAGGGGNGGGSRSGGGWKSAAIRVAKVAGAAALVELAGVISGRKS